MHSAQIRAIRTLHTKGLIAGAAKESGEYCSQCFLLKSKGALHRDTLEAKDLWASAVNACARFDESRREAVVCAILLSPAVRNQIKVCTLLDPTSEPSRWALHHVAAILHGEVVESARVALPHDDPLIDRAEKNQAFALQEAAAQAKAEGKAEAEAEAAEAEAAARNVYEARKARLGERHLDTLSAQGLVARACCDRGKYEEAWRHALFAWLHRKDALGTHAPLTLAARSLKATVRVERAFANAAKPERGKSWTTDLATQLDLAIEEHENVVRDNGRVLGHDHRHTEESKAVHQELVRKVRQAKARLPSLV